MKTKSKKVLRRMLRSRDKRMSRLDGLRQFNPVADDQWHQLDRERREIRNRLKNEET